MFSTYPDLENLIPELSKKPKISKDGTYAKWNVKRTYIGDVDVNIYFYFTQILDGRYIFTSVEITSDSYNFENLMDILITKYGEPTKVKTTENIVDGTKSPMSQSLSWNIKELNLKINAVEYNDRTGMQKFLDAFGSKIEKKLNENESWRSNIIIEVVKDEQVVF